MALFLYRCPNLRFQVQGCVPDDAALDGGETYESVTCTACRQTHLVNPATGKVLGFEDE